MNENVFHKRSLQKESPGPTGNHSTHRRILSIRKYHLMLNTNLSNRYLSLFFSLASVEMKELMVKVWIHSEWTWGTWLTLSLAAGTALPGSLKVISARFQEVWYWYPHKAALGQKHTAHQSSGQAGSCWHLKSTEMSQHPQETCSPCNYC